MTPAQRLAKLRDFAAHISHDLPKIVLDIKTDRELQTNRQALHDLYEQAMAIVERNRIPAQTKTTTPTPTK